jgi:phospholipase C
MPSLPLVAMVARAAAVGALVAACAGQRFTPGGAAASAAGPSFAGRAAESPIAHVVVVIQENRSFNNLFATFPGADGTTVGKSSGGTIAVAKTNLIVKEDLSHDFLVYRTSRDGGKMDGFNLLHFPNGSPEGSYPYRYVDPAQIQPYWTMAKEYVLAEHMFTTQGSGSFTAHQDLIAGGTVVRPNEAIVDFPTGSDNVWGCDAAPGTVTSLITQGNHFRPDVGPFPCFTYPTLRNLLDAKRISWRYYAPRICCTIFGRTLTAFDAIRAVRYGPEWKTNISSPQTNIFQDISSGRLANVSWLIPDLNDSDHPGTRFDTGPSWVADVVNAIGESSYWNSTAVVILWDDWGGFYDGLDPPQFGYGGLGFRVPAIVVSPYAKAHYISKTQYEFGSILKFIEKNWHLGRLGTSDKRARGIEDCFDFDQKPRPFSPIPVKYSRSYFLNERPSNLPVDTDM